MRIKMLETRRGTEDGFTVKRYYTGHEYEVKPHLAHSFWAAGFAMPVGEKSSKRNKESDARKKEKENE